MHYLAWPLVEGEILEKVVQEQGKLPPHQSAQIGLQIAEGLDICHQQGLIHGLLKPSNVMIGAENQVHILDFGIGCLLAETEGESLVDTMSTANSVTSGLDCASPESIMDPTNLTPAGDQYSLGCVLYFLLTGEYPFPEGNAAEKMMAHQFQQPKPILEMSPDVPPAMIEVVTRLMQKAPDARFGSASEVVDALRPLASGSGAGFLPRVAKKSSAVLPRVKAAPPRPAVAESPKTAPVAKPLPEAKPAAAKPAPAAKSVPPGAKPVPPAAKPVAPSAPTPRPATIGTLPSRDVLRGTKPASAPTPPPPPKTEPALPVAERIIPGAVEGKDPRSWDDQLGPLGIALSAGVACALVYFLAILFRLF
jgi:serine/threonine-protein kinase